MRGHHPACRWALCIALCACVQTFGGAIGDSLVFLADYTRTMDSVAGMDAAGKPVAGKAHLLPKPVFDFDTMAHTVRGLTVGVDAASVSYPSAAVLPAGKGTIELTVKPQDWQGDDMQTHMLLQSVVGGKTPFGKLFFYKYRASGLSAYFEFTDQGDKVFLHRLIKDWKARSWHHLALTYDLPGKLVLYVDGLPVDEAHVDRSPPWPKEVCVGPRGEFGRAGRTTIGVLATYNRALTGEEIKALAGERLPDLKTKLGKTADVGKRIVGTRSPWHAGGRPKLGLKALDPDTVLPPWSPVELAGSAVSVWGRRYSFGGTGMLDSIQATREELLAAPISLMVGDQSVAFAKPVVLGEPAKGQVTLRREARKGGKVLATFDVQVAYDGLVQCTLALSAGRVDGVSLRIPLRREHSRFVHYVGAPHGYESQDLPRNSYSKALPDTPGTVFESGFRTTAWVGSNERGLLWCAESDQFWWPKDRPDAIQITRKADGAAELLLNLAAEKLPGPARELIYRFGLMATPVKPRPAGWRNWTFTAQYDGIRGTDRGSHLIYWPDQWRFMGLDPDPHRAQDVPKNRARALRDHAADRKVIPYWSRLHTPVRQDDKIVPDGEFMCTQWATKPNRPGGGSHQFFRCSTTTGWADYLTWCVEEWASVMGRLDGVYVDETQPIPNTRAESGGGYDAVDGTRRPTFEYQGSRELYQRIMYNTWQRNGMPANSVAHCSATHTMQCLSPFTIMLIGEQYYSGYFTQNPELLPPEDDRVYYYSYALPMDRLRAECYGRQWGAVMLWLPCLKNQKDILTNPLTTRDMLSRVMQADMVVWPLFCNPDEVRKTWAFRREFGIGDPGVEFVPYWENQRFTTNRDGVVAGYYQNGTQSLVLVSNLNRRPETVQLTVGAGKVTNAETGQAIPAVGGKVKLELRRNDYVALRIGN